MAKSKMSLPEFEERAALLESTRTRKMAQSPHRYVRGNTTQFYEWLSSGESVGVPEGPPVWICGDCHVGNLGPVADAKGRVRIHIRDLDQTVIGNPSHDLLRLALSLASAARGSNLPGVTTAHMLEAIMRGYESALDHDYDEEKDSPEPPRSVTLALKEAHRRTWKHLAKERIDDTHPDIPLGKRFWPVTDEERAAIQALFSDARVHEIATMIRSRESDADVEVIDTAYWMKGCSSLGLLRFGVLLGLRDEDAKSFEYCLMDIKEATASAAPSSNESAMPPDFAERVVQGARHISPFLGERMRATTLLDRPVFIRELLPQDLKLELDQLTIEEGLRCAEYLASVVGLAHARQMDTATRTAWQTELASHRSKELDAPSWLWSNVLGLLIDHERTYLEHCRQYALQDAARTAQQ